MVIRRLPPLNRDIWIIVGVSLLISQLFISIGADDSWFTLLLAPHFLPDTLFVLSLTTALWLYVRQMTGYLQQKFDWFSHALLRILAQTIFGLVIPSIVCIFAVAFYFYIYYRVPVTATSFPDYELPFSVIIIAQFNLYYLIYYFYHKTKAPTTGSAIAETKRSIVGSVGRKNIPVDLQDIANAFIKNTVVHVTTFDGATLSVGYTLDEISLLLGETDYFRANRQVILHRKSCKSFVNEPNGKLLIELEPPINEPVSVSQLKAAEFRKWIGAT